MKLHFCILFQDFPLSAGHPRYLICSFNNASTRKQGNTSNNEKKSVFKPN